MNTLNYESFEDLHREDVFNDVIQDYSEFRFEGDDEKTHLLMSCITDLIIERSYYKTKMQQKLIENDELKALQTIQLLKEYKGK